MRADWPSGDYIPLASRVLFLCVNARSPYSWPGGVGRILSRNTMRTVAVWMEEYGASPLAASFYTLAQTVLLYTLQCTVSRTVVAALPATIRETCACACAYACARLQLVPNRSFSFLLRSPFSFSFSWRRSRWAWRDNLASLSE